MLNPSFHIQLNELFEVGKVCFGKFDGKNVTLAAAVSGNRILLHSPHVQDKHTPQTTYLRVKQRVVALVAGCLDESTGRDILFIGTAQAVQAYDVERNADIFYVEVAEGVNCMTVGACSKSPDPLLYIGSNLSIVGVDESGKEQMWTVTGEDVLALTPFDVDCDSRQELAAGTKASDILVFKEVLLRALPPGVHCTHELTSREESTQCTLLHKDLFDLRNSALMIEVSLFGVCLVSPAKKGPYYGKVRINQSLNAQRSLYTVSSDHQGCLQHDVKEAHRVTNLVDLGQGLLAFSLANCTIGVYEGPSRVWRVKSKHTVNSLCAIGDEHCDADTVFSGWQNGKVEARSPASGDVLFRENLPHAVVHVNFQDFRQDGCKQVIACMANGEVRGYTSSNSLSAVLQIQKDVVALEQALQALEQKKREAAQELNLVNQNLNEQSTTPATACVADIIPADTTVTCDVEVNCENLQLELLFTSSNQCVVKGVVIFAEGVFSGECLFVHPDHPTTTLTVPLKPAQDSAIDMLSKVIIGSPTSDVFHVLDLKTNIVAFAMYVPQNLPPLKRPEGSATFCIPDAPGQVCNWLQDKFVCDMVLDPSGCGSMHILCLRDGESLVIDVGVFV